MVEELAYSIHLGTDRNKTTKAKEIASTTASGETSFSNNAIQNATQLSKVNKHNLRDYDNMKDKIYTIYGTDNLYRDVQQLYLQEFEQARIEYNNKQTREDRKIQDYLNFQPNPSLSSNISMNPLSIRNRLHKRFVYCSSKNITHQTERYSASPQDLLKHRPLPSKPLAYLCYILPCNNLLPSAKDKYSQCVVFVYLPAEEMEE